MPSQSPHIPTPAPVTGGGASRQFIDSAFHPTSGPAASLPVAGRPCGLEAPIEVRSPSPRPNANAAASASVLLASRSPRRRELLTREGVPHRVAKRLVDDTGLRSGPVTPAQWVVALAHLKAHAVIAEAQPNEPILAADTVCVFGAPGSASSTERIVGQPRSAQHAAAIIREARNAWHRVLTGVAILRLRDNGLIERDLFVNEARVHLGDLSDAAIDEYITSGDWQGKAGAYNLVDRLNAGWPIRYEGDPDAITGLPLRAVLSRLN